MIHLAKLRTVCDAYNDGVQSESVKDATTVRLHGCQLLESGDNIQHVSGYLRWAEPGMYARGGSS
jgi:hypothetical protein